MIPKSFLAPIHEYTDLPFRLLCQEYGAEAACLPLLNTKAIANKPKKLEQLVDISESERFVGVQLVGSDPVLISKTARLVLDNYPSTAWLNLNCGCPSENTIGTGGGSALMRQPQTIANAVTEMKKCADILVSVKIRIKENFGDTLEMCKVIESAGTDFLIVHGRTVKAGYSGRADWQMIKRLKDGIGIPLVGNGDITTAKEGEELVRGGFCDAFMIGRAAMKNPMLFKNEEPDGLAGRRKLLERYIQLHEKHIGAPQTTDVKIKAVNFVSGVSDSAALRDRICRSKTVEEMINVLADRK
jgi:tRNA-dihydrouridine synthase B